MGWGSLIVKICGLALAIGSLKRVIALSAPNAKRGYNANHSYLEA
jgi:hypothetical protein